MHLGVPKIDDLVAELLVDIEPKDSNDPEDDYSIDDELMDAFLSSQIIPPKAEEVVAEDTPSEEVSINKELIVPDADGRAWYEVDEESIDDFVDYGKSNETLKVSDEPEADRSRGKRRVPVYIKAAALLLVLAGVGWMVSRIAIQAAGSPEVT